MDSRTISSLIARTEAIVNGNFAEFVFQDADFPLGLLLQNVVHQRGLPGAQKASNHCDWSQVALVSCHGEIQIRQY